MKFYLVVLFSFITCKYSIVGTYRSLSSARKFVEKKFSAGDPVIILRYDLDSYERNYSPWQYRFVGFKEEDYDGPENS